MTGVQTCALPIYRTFYSKLKQAEADAEISMIRIINIAAYKDWRAAAFKLERAWAKRWGQHKVEELEETNTMLQEKVNELLSKLRAEIPNVIQDN